jgi:NDP-sugar pyrophosphorylase family protein
MQALILAGGKGTRLRPYTTILPKPLMPVGDHPILEIILRQLSHHGVRDVILAVGYQGHLFQAFFQDGKRFDLRLEYSFETEPLGTAGPIGLVLDRMEEDFLVMNGDLLTTLNYRKLWTHHMERGADATIGTFQRDVSIDFGVIEYDGEGRLVRYIEKPTYHFQVSMGVNVLKAEAVRPHLTPGRYLDLPELMTALRENGKRVQCYWEPCQWLDIGRVDDYQRANEIFETHQGEFLPGGGGA